MSVEKLALRALISYFLVELVLVPGLSLSQPYLFMMHAFVVIVYLFFSGSKEHKDDSKLPSTT
jgi:hypothetical protein